MRAHTSWMAREAVLLLVAAVLLTVAPVAAGAISADEVMQQQRKVTASDAATLDHFGNSVAVYEDTMAVGAPFSGDPGAVYVYVRSGEEWVLQQKITPFDGAANDYFGSTVALSGSTLLVGAPDDDDNGVASGSAYVYTRGGTVWAFQQKLTASDGAAVDQFARALALSGDRAIIGAPADDDNAASNSGSAYIFERSAGHWTQTEKIHATDPAADDVFGDAVAIDGTTVVIASYKDDTMFVDSGSVHFFSWDGSDWIFRGKLTTLDEAAGDNFGYSVAVSGNTALVSSWLDDDNGSNSGSVYVYNRSGNSWYYGQKLTAADGTANDDFGSSVALWGDTAVIGAYGDGTPWASGTAYVFVRSGASFTQLKKLVPTDPVQGGNFGISSALYGQTAVVGAENDDALADDAGAVYAFVTQSPVYRFYNKRIGTHFYTPNEAEKANVVANLSATYTYEGVAYKVNADGNTQPLYRFYNKRNGSHFYTASVAERNSVIANLSATYTYEGETYKVTPAFAAGKLPVYRFFNKRNGSHFYTASATERDNVITHLAGTYTYEGTAFWLGQ